MRRPGGCYGWLHDVCDTVSHGSIDLVEYDILAVLGAGEDLVDNQYPRVQIVNSRHTLGQPGNSQACTFLPFLALVMRCVVGV